MISSRAVRPVLFIVLLVLAACAMPAEAANPNAKWFVCKYTGTPGVDETLQTGQNPISVSESAIPISPVVPGATFSDSQGRSLVLEEDTGQAEPAAECPEVLPTPTPTPSPSPSGGFPTPSLFSIPCTPGVVSVPRVQVDAVELAGLHLFLDGLEVVLDGDGVAEIAEGTHAWEIRDDAGAVLAAGSITVAGCTLTVNPTPTPTPTPPPCADCGPLPTPVPLEPGATPLPPPPGLPDTATGG